MERWSLANIEQSPNVAVSLLDLGTHPHIYPIPGCIIVHTTAGLYIMDPITLTPMPCKMLQARDVDPHSEDDGIDGNISRPQFNIVNCTLKILSVFCVNWSPNKDKQSTDNDPADSPSSSTLVTKDNSVNDQWHVSCVAMAINHRLIVMKIMRR